MNDSTTPPPAPQGAGDVSGASTNGGDAETKKAKARSASGLSAGDSVTAVVMMQGPSLRRCDAVVSRVWPKPPAGAPAGVYIDAVATLPNGKEIKLQGVGPEPEEGVSIDRPGVRLPCWARIDG